MRSRSVPRALAPCSALLVLALVSSLARADESSGTWTGHVELRTNHYWDASTNVDAPEVRVRLDSPEGTRIEAGYLLDAITTASVAAGAQEDIVFTEVRHQGGLSLSRELDLGSAQLRIGTSGRISSEPDYFATAVTSSGALSLNQRSTVLSLALTYAHDDVGAVLRGGGPRTDVTGRDLSDRGRQGQLEAFAAVLGWSQVLSPVATLAASYQLVHASGFLQNPYRRARVSRGLTQELHPDERTRHTLSGRLAYFIPQTSTAIHLGYRAYLDDWGVAAINPEIRVYQMLGRSALLRLRYRFYDQVGSFFFRTDYGGDESFFSADPKMSRFDSHLAGVELRIALDFLAGTPLSFLDRAWLDMSFNYWFQTSGFGDGILAQTGIRAPF